MYVYTMKSPFWNQTTKFDEANISNYMYIVLSKLFTLCAVVWYLH